MLVKKKRFPIAHIITIGLLPSAIKKMVYRARGYRIGKNVSLGIGSVILGKEVRIEKNTSIGFFSIIKAEKLQIDAFVKIGAMVYIDTTKVEIGEDSRINEQVFIGGIKNPDSALILGKRVIIMQMSFLNPTKTISIGDDSGVGGDCLIFTHGSWNSILENYPVTFAEVKIGKNVWLPWRVFIGPGVEIGDGSVIGANSFVNKSVPAYSMAAGSPAKVIKSNLNTSMENGDKSKILRNILQEFEQYLNYHGYSTLDKSTAENTSDFTFKKDASNFHICLHEKGEMTGSKLKTQNILIQLDGPETKLIADFEMVVNINKKERIGTSEIGEELVSYFSRYGIRFNRID